MGILPLVLIGIARDTVRAIFPLSSSARIDALAARQIRRPLALALDARRMIAGFAG